MVDPKFGTKRVCEACGGKFYDLNKIPVVCPLCGHSFDPNSASAQIAPVVEVAPALEQPETDEDDAPKKDNEISLDDIVEEDDDDSDDELGEFDDGTVLVADDDEDDLLEDDAGDDDFIEDEDDD